MECHIDSSEKKTPSKKIVQAMNGKFGHGAISPFRKLQNYSTPPSRLSKIKNPFESVLNEKLHTHFFSPTVFSKVATESVMEDTFKWTIDELSNIKPADIDEESSEQYEHDASLESFAQSRIDTFFSLQEIVPSPYTNIKQSPLINELLQTPSPKFKPKTCDNTAQTILTLPPRLPDYLEDLLAPFCSYAQNQQGGDMSMNSSLHRKLFDSNRESMDSAQSSPANSLNLNMPPILFSSPLASTLGLDSERYFKSPDNCNISNEVINNCSLSPISSSSRSPIRKDRSRLNLTTQMSVDGSMGCVPDISYLPLINKSVALDSTTSPIAQLLSDSTVHWDMEYKEIMSSPKSSNTSTNEMDVSTSNTPKSKIFISQRKKLSDSFHVDYESDDEGNNYTRNVELNPPNTYDNSKIDLTDAGYHTGTISEDSSTWTNSNLFASTPTKQRLLN